jgi:hypothetical protein
VGSRGAQRVGEMWSRTTLIKRNVERDPTTSGLAKGSESSRCGLIPLSLHAMRLVLIESVPDGCLLGIFALETADAQHSSQGQHGATDVDTQNLFGAALLDN